MSDTERLERNSEWETIRLFAVACIVVAGLMFAQDTAMLVRAHAAAPTVTAIKSSASLISPMLWRACHWLSPFVLLVAGAGLFYVRRWGWWLALGYGVTVIGLGMLQAAERTYPAYSIWFFIREILPSVLLTVLQPQFSITLLVFLLLPSTRAAFRRADELCATVLPVVQTDAAVGEVRAMGWLVLLIATPVVIAMAVMLGQVESVPPAGSNAPAGFNELLQASWVTQQFLLVPANTIVFSIGVAAAFGMIKRRTWARRATLLFGVFWVTVGVLGYGLNSYFAAKYPVDWTPGAPPLGLVARSADVITGVLGLISRIVFPMLLIAFVCLPHVRRFMSSATSAQSEAANSVA